MMRALLPHLAPLQFQHLMRVLHNDFFARLDPTGAGRCTNHHASTRLDVAGCWQVHMTEAALRGPLRPQ